VWSEEAVKFIKRHSHERFFLHVTYNAPHTPLQAPEEEIEPFMETGTFNKGVSTLYGMLHRMDSGVGQILETLKECGIEENTIVMFTSDNGPQFGGQGETKLDRFNCQLHGAKGSVYEGGIRVPMILRWPAGLDGGYEVSDMVHFSDWFPTILAMADVQIPDHLNIDGINILPVIRGEKDKACTKRFWQWNRYTPVETCNAAVRDGDWKLVRPAIQEAMQAPCCKPWLHISMYEPERLIEEGLLQEPEPSRTIPEPPAPELYNIAEDPLESCNLADQYPDMVRKLLTELETWFEEVEHERSTIDDAW
jgi:arylsulfatase A